MKCPACQYENKDNALVCNLCKAVLRRETSDLPAPADGAAPAPAREHDTAPRAPAAPPVTSDEERVDLALREMVSMILSPMPPAPRELPRVVKINVDHAKFPETCPGCGERANTKLDVVSNFDVTNPSGQRMVLRVPFCRRCVNLTTRRKMNLIYRSIVVGTLFLLATMVHVAFAAALLVELCRCAYFALKRAWLFGARIDGAAQLSDPEVRLAIDDRAYAEELATLNPPRAVEAKAAEPAHAAPKRAPAIETFAPTARSHDGPPGMELDDRTDPVERAERKVGSRAPIELPPAGDGTEDTHIPSRDAGVRDSSAPPPLPERSVNDTLYDARAAASAANAHAQVMQAPVNEESQTAPDIELAKPSSTPKVSVAAGPARSESPKPAASVPTKPARSTSVPPAARTASTATSPTVRATSSVPARSASTSSVPARSVSTSGIPASSTAASSRPVSTSTRPAPAPAPPAAARTASTTSRPAAPTADSKISWKCDEGDTLMREKRFVQALVKFEEALALLPAPDDKSKAATRIHASIGEASFHLSDWAATKKHMSLALSSPGGAGEPALLLRLGQALYELGEEALARETLSSAYHAGGPKILDGAAEKYRALVSSA